MAHQTCPQCSFVAYGDSSEIKRILTEHIQREHEQGYRRSDSWMICGVCRGTGKNTWGGGECTSCRGSGRV